MNPRRRTDTEDDAPDSVDDEAVDSAGDDAPDSVDDEAVDSVDDEAVDSAGDALDAVDRDILQFVSAHDAVSPGVVAFELEYDIGTVYDRLGRLRRRGFLLRSEWSACSLSERGRDYLTDVDV